MHDIPVVRIFLHTAIAATVLLFNRFTRSTVKWLSSTLSRRPVLEVHDSNPSRFSRCEHRACNAGAALSLIFNDNPRDVVLMTQRVHAVHVAAPRESELPGGL